MVLHPDFLRLPLAHRGLHDAQADRPENSPAAFAAAIRQGYGIELDLQVSVDGQAIVFHDPELDRLTDETGLVRGRTAAALQKIGLKNGPDTIPTLAEILSLVNGQVPLLIEMKDQDGRLGRNIGKLPGDVARLLRSYDGPVAVMSYNPYAVAAVAQTLPDLPVGLVTGSFSDPGWDDLPSERRENLINISGLQGFGGCFISHNENDLNSPHLARIKAQGLPVLCWTIRTPEQEVEARKIADNITFEGYLA